MRQSFRLIVQFSSYICTVQAYKFTSTSRIDFVIVNDSHDLLQKTGVKLAIFQYEAFDETYVNPEVSYRQTSPQLPTPNFSFEYAIRESIKRHECNHTYTLKHSDLENPVLL